MTESFGARLRRERERRQISLQEIADRTKIKASLFEALERDDASRWPSGIFRRAFIRGYADAVGLDADATAREFSERFPDPDMPASPPPAQQGPGTPRHPAAVPAAVVPQPPARPDEQAAHGLRLTLVDSRWPFTGGRVLTRARQRWAAAAWDLGSILGLALTIFVCLDTFWVPFGITALCYYVGGVLILGNSPGVCLFAPRVVDETSGGPPPTRAARPRHPETTRPAEASFRTHRVRATRGRQIHG